MGSIKHAPGRPCCSGVEPKANTNCCLTLTGGFATLGYVLTLPASDIRSPCPPQDNVTPGHHFGDLIVEVNGSLETLCNQNGSYLLRSGAGIGSGSCQWNYEGRPANNVACPDFSVRVIRVAVTVAQGNVSAQISSNGPNGTRPTLTFLRSFTTATVPDFSEPYEIPNSGLFDPWDDNIPLVVYMA